MSNWALAQHRNDHADRHHGVSKVVAEQNAEGTGVKAMTIVRSQIRKWSAAAAIVLLLGTSAMAADLADIKKRGELRHLGIKYANFVTGAGDGFDVELMQGFAGHLGVKYRLVYSDFYNVIRDLLGRDVVRQGADVSLAGEFPITGDVIATGFTILPWREAVLLYSEPTFPSQVLLVAPAQSLLQPRVETSWRPIFEKPRV